MESKRGKPSGGVNRDSDHLFMVNKKGDRLLFITGSGSILNRSAPFYPPAIAKENVPLIVEI